MFRIILIFVFMSGFSGTSFSAEDKVVQLPYSVELNRPIIFSMKYKEVEEGVSIAVSEDFFLTPIKEAGETVIYSVVSRGAQVDNMKGLPPGLDTLIEELIEQASGLSYEYAADNTGYPLELVESREVKSFMKKMAKGMKKWLDRFVKSKNMNKQQKDQMKVVLDQGMAPLLTNDNEELSRMILEELELVFAVTGRNLYVDFQTVYDSSRYFDDGELYMDTQDNWQVDDHDEKAGKISISMTQALHPEEFPAFLERLQAGLVDDYSKADVKAIVDIWANMELYREASYVVDMRSGLPISGKIYSETTFEGKTKSQTIEFTSTY